MMKRMLPFVVTFRLDYEDDVSCVSPSSSGGILTLINLFGSKFSCFVIFRFVNLFVCCSQTSTNFRAMVQNWNMQTNLWLKR